jgi:hypothetical protein
MSAYKTIQCSFKDKNILLDCLKELGYEPVVYKEKSKLSGYRGDQREQTAEIIVPRTQISPVSNDLGFTFDEEKNEYLMLCSEYDSHKGLEDKVKQSYAVTAIKLALSKNKFSVKTETKAKDKTITITAGKII